MSQPFVILEGVAAPVFLDNIDTDQIIPGKELMRVTTSGFGDGLFSEWRYLEGRIENPDFILNREPFRESKILLAGYNFACGSSREVAAWALRDFGIRCVIASSYGGIFYANCFNNGLLPVVLKKEEIAALVEQVQSGRPRVTVDLERCEVVSDIGIFPFPVANFHREMLLKGLTLIDLTLLRVVDIDAYQERDRKRRPWIYM